MSNGYHYRVIERRGKVGFYPFEVQCRAFWFPFWRILSEHRDLTSAQTCAQAHRDDPVADVGIPKTIVHPLVPNTVPPPSAPPQPDGEWYPDD